MDLDPDTPTTNAHFRLSSTMTAPFLQNHKKIMRDDSRSTRNRRPGYEQTHSFWIIYWPPHSFKTTILPFFHNLASPFIQHTRAWTKIPFLGHESAQLIWIMSPSLITVSHFCIHFTVTVHHHPRISGGRAPRSSSWLRPFAARLWGLRRGRFMAGTTDHAVSIWLPVWLSSK